MKNQIALLVLLIAFPLSVGCGMCRSIEQWKCDNWGMCHFAPNRAGMYAPMSVQPTYGPPAAYPAPAGMVLPTASVPSGSVAPTSASVTVGGPVNPNCKDCGR
ncbi:MAG: hypothetical protein ACKOAU_03915 [Pirellula sp.]